VLEIVGVDLLLDDVGMADTHRGGDVAEPGKARLSARIISGRSARSAA
jgi:hypothetical protein